ncbi:hypothetical protein AAGV37_00625 [Pseudomonas protegens]|uniref:hypothetical protein n=1 Tax=Pseudomonas protegens TaxID=380021 RepID=UPI003157F92E
MKNTKLLLLLLLVAAVAIAATVIFKKNKQSAERGAEFALSSIAPWDISRYHLPRAEFQSDFHADGFVRVPFTSLGGRGDEPLGDLYVNKRYESKFIAFGLEIDFPLPGVPVDLNVIDGQYHFAFRKVFDGQLFHLTYNGGGKLLKMQSIQIDGVDFPIFRASTVGKKHLYWVVYDNKKRKNYMMDVDYRGGKASQMIELPTFYPPAGTTYEMEAPIFFSGDAESGFELIAGALYAKIKDGQVEGRRLSYCETVIETVFTKDGPVVLCRAPEGKDSSYLLSEIDRSDGPKYLDMAEGIPWKLDYSSDGAITVRRAQSRDEIVEMYLWDIRRGQQSGVLEFGVNNIEGRIPWSQIYYLNGLMDVLLLSEVNQNAQNIFGNHLGDVVSRISLEIHSLDDLLDTEQGFYTKAFTHDRSMALFAVQTSRLLLLFDRYSEEFPSSPQLKNIEKLRRMVTSLEGHIDQVAHEGEDAAWMKPGSAHLRWPKCSAFYFDGMAVPFNHQNEWAYSLFNAARFRGESTGSSGLSDQRDIIQFFMRRLSDDGGFPATEDWYYWYGHAYDGWTREEGRSCNTPSYPGDHGLAWISFRTIDFMSVMSALDFVKELKTERFLESAVDAVKYGDVYPFASRSLLAVGKIPQIQLPVLERYYRATAPWELANSPWALVMGFGIDKKLQPDFTR